MPISFIAANLLAASAEAQFNAINLAGVMGAGIVLSYALRVATMLGEVTYHDEKQGGHLVALPRQAH